MQKRKFIGKMMLAAAVIIYLGAINVSSVQAGGENFILDVSNTNNFFKTKNAIDFTKIDNTVAFLGVTDISVSGVTYAKWLYMTNWENPTAAHIFILVPAGCNGENKYYCGVATDCVVTNHQVAVPCEMFGPTPAINGDNCTQYVAIKWTPNTPSNEIWFLTEKKSTPVFTTILGCKTGSCDVGPNPNDVQYWARTFGPSLSTSCAPPPYIPSVLEERKKVDGVPIKVKKNVNGERCNTQVYKCTDDTYLNCTLITPVKMIVTTQPNPACAGLDPALYPECQTHTGPLRACTDDSGNQECSECIVQTHINPCFKNYCTTKSDGSTTCSPIPIPCP